jgi:hypothetical protein
MVLVMPVDGKGAGGASLLGMRSSSSHSCRMCLPAQVRRYNIAAIEHAELAF